MPALPDLLQAVEVALQQWRVRTAVDTARQATRAHPDAPTAWRALGRVLLRTGLDVPGAVEALHRADELDPGHAPTVINLAIALRTVGRLPEAIRRLTVLLEAQPTHAHALFTFGNLQRASGNDVEAARAYQRALESRPGHAPTLQNLGNTLVDLRRLDDAEVVFNQVLDLERTPAAVMALARLCHRQRKAEQARQLANEALELEPWVGGPLLTAPQAPQAELLLATLDRADRDYEAALVRLDRVITSGAPDPIKGSALVQKGHVLDRMSRHDEAFAAFQEGQSRLTAQQPDADERSRSGRARIRRDTQTIAAMTLPSITVEPMPRPPVFIVGFPRSGTTLLEQLFGAHPDFVTSDERPLLQQALARLDAISGTQQPWPELLQQLDAPTVAALRAAYEDICIESLGDEARERRVVDKQPLNITYAAAIDRIFPDARIIVALRDPRDVCLSCFFQDFGARAAGHFYHLESTVDLYDAVMGHWLDVRERLSIPWMEVRYEDVTSDLESTARRLVDFVGAPWAETVLDFGAHAAARAVSTPSYHDVTQGVYRRSVARWRQYETHISSFMPQLEPYVEAFGGV